MDSQMDIISIFNPQDFPKLREGERVEVRQKDVGLRGSWHSGTIVGLKAGRRLVEYDELLTDDGHSKLRESIPCPKLSESSPPKSNALVVTPSRSPSKRRGLLRPCPPPRTEPLPLTWKGGLFVDVFYQDAWWEAVLLNDVTSLDDGVLVDVIFPDEGDLARVYVKDMRISQCWDEVTGDWSNKGSIDLSRFLKRRGIRKKEVNSTADSDCRASEACNSFTCDEVKVNKNGWIPPCAALVSRFKDEDTLTPVIQVSGSAAADLNCKAIVDKPFEEASPLKDHENRSSTYKNTIQTLMPSRDGGVIFDLAESERHLEISSCSGKSGKVICEGPQHQDIRHSGPLCGTDTETVDPGKKLVAREDVAECRGLSCCKRTEGINLGRETVEEKVIQGSLFFKRRKIGEVPPNSYLREAKFSASQSVHPSPLHNRPVEELSSGKGGCIGRGSTAYRGAVHSRGLSNLKSLSKCSSALALKETDMQLSLGSEDDNLLKKTLLSPPPMGNLDCWNGYKKENMHSQARPICTTYLLALEAPVRKSREEYEQIVLAGKAALGGGMNSGRAKKMFAKKSLEEDNRIILAGKRMFEGGVLEMVMRPRTQAGKGVPLRVQNSRENYGTTAGKSRLGGVALERASRSGRIAGEAAAQKPGEDSQITLARERSARIKKPAGNVLTPVGTTERGGKNETLRSFRDDLVRQKQVALKRKASSLSSISEAGGKNAKLLKVSKPDRLVDESEAATISCLSNREDSTAVKRKGPTRMKVMIGSNPTETASASASASCLSDGGGINVAKVLRPKRQPDQADAATTPRSSNVGVKRPQTIDNKSLKNLASEIGKKAVLEAGFTLEYRPRRDHSHFDAVYISPKGYSYWSLPKAWRALEKEKKKGRIKVEKAVIQQVLSKIDNDEKLRFAFERLDRFSGTCLQEVMSRANMTYAELTDVLLEDLHVLKKNIQKSRGKKRMDKNRPVEKNLGRKTVFKADLKTSLLASESLLVKKRGRKRKQEVSGVVDCRASTSKVYSRLKHVQGDSLHKKRSRKAPIKAGSSCINTSVEKQGNNVKGLSKNNGIEVGNLTQESSQKKEKSFKSRSGLRLEVRPSSSCMDDASEDLSCHGKRTVVSWMIGRGAVLETERISCVDQVSNEVLKDGVLTREGILCRCCKKVYTVKGFEEHGGSQERGSHRNLLFASGKTLLDCQVKAWNTEVHLRRTQNYKGVSANDTNDDTCLLCGDGGVLLCCDLCPSTFHASCLQLESVPEGSWYCPKCRCGVCKGRHTIEEEAVCIQCEHIYHISCLQGGHTLVREQLLCTDSCKKIYSGLQNLTGISHSLGKGFSWTLLRCIEEPQTEDFQIVMENNSKLAVALLVLKECFNPMDDPRTNIDMITHAAYNRGSQFSRLNYVGFYTVVLEREDEIISVASIRIHGARVAEMPLIGTRHKYRRQGMCRLLVSAIEKLLLSLEVATFILPAISELYETWTKAFGFKPLDTSLRSEIKDLSMMMFPGTDLLQKSLLGNSASCL